MQRWSSNRPFVIHLSVRIEFGREDDVGVDADDADDDCEYVWFEESVSQ